MSVFCEGRAPRTGAMSRGCRQERLRSPKPSFADSERLSDEVDDRAEECNPHLRLPALSPKVNPDDPACCKKAQHHRSNQEAPVKKCELSCVPGRIFGKQIAESEQSLTGQRTDTADQSIIFLHPIRTCFPPVLLSQTYRIIARDSSTPPNKIFSSPASPRFPFHTLARCCRAFLSAAAHTEDTGKGQASHPVDDGLPL